MMVKLKSLHAAAIQSLQTMAILLQTMAILLQTIALPLHTSVSQVMHLGPTLTDLRAGRLGSKI